MDPLEARHLFPLAEHYIHMNHAGVSPMSAAGGRAAIEQVVDASMNRPYRDHWAQDEADTRPRAGRPADQWIARTVDRADPQHRPRRVAAGAGPRLEGG